MRIVQIVGGFFLPCRRFFLQRPLCPSSAFLQKCLTKLEKIHIGTRVPWRKIPPSPQDGSVPK
jgi:hypothetical protein